MPRLPTATSLECASALSERKAYKISLCPTPHFAKIRVLDTENKTCRTLVIGSLVLFTLVFVVFGRTLWHGFASCDDSNCTFGNPLISKGITVEGVKWASTHPVNANWIPVTTLSHMLDCKLYGLAAGGHHFTSILIHALTSVILYIALYRLTGAVWRSMSVATIFAVHPLRAESVAWIAERKDVLSGLFFVLTLLTYAKYCQTNAKHRRNLYIVALVLFALGLMSKPMLVSVPLVLLIIDFWPLNRLQSCNWKTIVAEKIPFAALSLAASIVALMTQKNAEASAESLSAFWRLGNAVISYVIYVKQLIVPTGLSVFYVHRGANISVITAVICLLVLVIVSALVWKERYKRPYLLAGWLWYLIMLVPVIGIVQVGAQAHADRFTYLPHIGLLIAASWGCADFNARFSRARRFVPWATVLIVICLSITTFAQTDYWRDTERLWTYASENSDPSALIETTVGTAQMSRGEIEGAIHHFQRALSIDSNYAIAHNNVGYLLMLKGDADAALRHYQAAFRLDPHNAIVLRNLGMVCDMKGQKKEAINFYEKALTIDPHYADAHYNLGNHFANEERFEEAITQFRAALETNPNDVLTHMNLANALSRQNLGKEADLHYQRAIELNPEEPRVHYNFGVALCTQSNFVEAARQFEQALDLGKKHNKADVITAARQRLDEVRQALLH
jgi:protein O-mannosyl-transferase